MLLTKRLLAEIDEFAVLALVDCLDNLVQTIVHQFFVVFIRSPVGSLLRLGLLHCIYHVGFGYGSVNIVRVLFGKYFQIITNI